jgi:hypothetical protein
MAASAPKAFFLAAKRGDAEQVDRLLATGEQPDADPVV